jgi:3-oxoacyl-(acyl-carrier-protein) synthase
LKRPPAITGLGALGALGHDLAAHHEALAAGRPGLRPLGDMPGAPAGFDLLPAGWITPRSHLSDRKWSPSSMAAIHVAAEALAAANWTPAERRTAVVFFGSSRGPLAGWTDPWPGRRGFDLLAATNSLPAEPAAAVSTVHGIGGPWQVTSTGCCSGLDALATAELWLQAGRIDRALVVAVDLPLVGPVLDAYARTGLLAGPGTDGMAPAEAAAALCLESDGSDGDPLLLGCHTAADPAALLGNGRDPAPLARLLTDATALHGTPDLVIPHASGTAGNLKLETEALATCFGGGCPAFRYKPHTGHGIGASGLLELVLALHGAFPPGAPAGRPSTLFKLASALGGRHSLACVSPAP